MEIKIDRSDTRADQFEFTSSRPSVRAHRNKRAYAGRWELATRGNFESWVPDPRDR